MPTFTGRAEAKSVSLPADLWDWLKDYNERTGVPVSVFVRRAVERAVPADSRQLVDPPAPYCTAERGG